MNNQWWIEMLKAAAPELEFDWLEADDESSVDDQLELIGTRVTVQLGDGYVAINEEIRDENDNFIGLTDFGIYDYNPALIPQIVAKLRGFERYVSSCPSSLSPA